MSNVKYFAQCTTKQDAKQTFRTLAKKYHPDTNKDTDTTEIMKAIINEYESILKTLPSDNTNNTTNTSNMSDDEFSAYVTVEMKEIIDNISHLPIDIEIIGQWLWVKAEKQYKSYLTAYNFLWSPNKLMYYWRLERDSMKGYKGKGKDIDEIRSTYGTTKVNGKERTYITA